jgi:nucleotide-binding universal stress UspA family protein
MDNEPILICYDGSPGADRAIEVAAKLLGPRSAVVLDVAPPVTPAESVAVTLPVSPSDAFGGLNLDDARRVADKGAALARASGFDAKAREAIASPTWEGIVDVADELDAPAIVIGSRGLNAFREAVEGSLSHEVAEHAYRPVLIVPPPPA